jgi:hypothetical protein
MAQFAIDEILTTGIQISGFIFDYSSRLGTPGQVLTSTSSGVMWQADSSNADLAALSGQIAATGTLLNNRINSLSGYANDTFLSGSGTQYYVPRWNTSKELVTGSIYDNGFVGIGITNPSGQLHLRNMGFTSQSGIPDSNIFPNATGVFGLVFDHNTYTNGQYRHRLIKVDRNGNLPLYLQQAGGVANQYINLARFGTHTYSTNTFEVFGDSRINGTASITSNLLVTGNVGIGTANPAVKLHIENSGTISSAATIRLVGSTGNNAGSQIEFYKAQTPEAAIGLASAVTGGLSDDLLLLSTNPNSIVLAAGLSGLATFKPDGKVGIGTINPQTLLSLGGLGSTSAASGLTFGGDAQANLYRSAEDTIRTDGSLVVNGNFNTNTTTVTTLNINAGTLPGIPAGSTITGFTYAVNNGNVSQINLVETRFATGSDWTTASTRIQKRTDVTNQAYIEFNPSGASYGMALGVGANSNVEALRILSNGSIGIGTTNPATKLHVYGAGGGFEFGVGSSNCYIEAIDRANTSAFINTSYYTRGTGYFAWYNGSYTERMRIASNGNVGINSTTPTAKLSINKGGKDQFLALDIANNDAKYAFYVDQDNNGSNSFSIWDATNSHTAIRYLPSSGGYWQLYTNNIERVRIDNNGNVGIGQTNPLSKFVVNAGTVNTTTYTTSEARIADGSLHLMKTVAGGIFESIRAMNMDTTAGTTVRVLAASTSDPFNNGNGGKVFIDAIRTATNMDLAFSLNDVAGAAAVERVRFMGNGNVGIGITNPACKLDVAGTIRSSTNEIYGFGASDNVSLRAASTSNVLGIYTSNVERLRLAANGYFGVGTDNPSTLLSIGRAGSTSAASGITFGAEAASNIYRSSTNQLKTDGSFVVTNTLIVGGGENGVRILKDGSDSISSTLYLANAGNTRAYNFQQNAAGTNLALWGFNSSNAWQNLVNFNYNGNVGIGTTAASGRLHIVSTTVGDTVLRADGTNGTLFSVVDDLSDSLMSVNNSAGLPVFEVFADDRIVAGQYGSGDFVLVNNKVGIGTSNPSYKLDVNGSLGINASTSDTNWPFVVSDNSSAGGRYALNKVGSMGFNYADAYAQLQLLGANGAYIDFTNSVGGDSNARLIYYAGNRLDLTYGFAPKSTISVTPNAIGIGTTNPFWALDVSGTAVRSFASGTIEPGFIVDYASSNGYGGLFIHTNGVRKWRIGNVGDTDSTSPALYIWQEGVGARMYFRNNGNIGIATTIPIYTLDVSGTIRGERYRGINSLVLNTYTTVNPASNVFLYSQANDRDSWIYLDSADTSSNWGIYHRQIDSAVSNLPANSIGFIGGGTSTLQSYISLTNGSAYFAGSVGIGTVSPTNTLQVNGQIAIKGDESADNVKIHIQASDNSNRYTIKTDLDGTTTNDLLIFRSNTVDNMLVLKGNGNVGIGTTNPTQKLDVAGYAMAGDGLYRTSIYGSNGGAWISFGDTGVLESLGRIGAYSALFNINSINGDTSFQYNSSEKMRITTAGNVGIGVTNPGVRLQVVNTGSVTSTSTVRIVGATGNGGGSQIEFFKGASQKFSIGTASAITGGLSDDLLIATLNPSSIILTAGLSGLAVFKTDGKVGIGTASPTTLLSVGGPGSTSAASGLTFGGDAEANLYRSAEDTIKTDGSLIVAGNVTATNLISGNGTANYVTKWNGTKSVANSQIFDDGTYVGVNTITNTTYRLQVNGSFAATTKSFDIVHPTISGKRLTYASLEGPENGVYYRGQNNNNEIILPHYWSGLVHDDSITVNLTAVGRRKDGKIRNYTVDQIGHNKVYIYTDSNDNIYNYYYTIFAERKDVSKLVTERDME